MNLIGSTNNHEEAPFFWAISIYFLFTSSNLSMILSFSNRKTSSLVIFISFFFASFSSWSKTDWSVRKDMDSLVKSRMKGNRCSRKHNSTQKECIRILKIYNTVNNICFYTLQLDFFLLSDIVYDNFSFTFYTRVPYLQML